VADVPPAELFKRLSQYPGVHEFAGQDERRLTLRFAGGASAQIVVTSPVNAGAVLVQATGSEAHLRELATFAATRGFALNGAALWRGSEFVATTDEERFYRALGLPVIPPELREGRGEVEAAAQGTLPRLLETRDLRGFLHCHTTYSDGSNSVEELALACRACGYEYVGITDHSQTAAYAGGLRPDDLLRQSDEIDQVNARLRGIRVLKGVEADILQDGRIDYESRILERLDFVIASVHSRFNMSAAEMTARILAAMDNPCLTIIGHPTGRLLLSRDAYGLDLDAVIEKASATGVALEVNADPHRLDLDWRVLRSVRDAGVPISIGADAHSIGTISNVEHGVAMARKGWLGPDDVLNARPLDGFLAHARRRHG
jgi:DNA polymerase (family 10)